MAGSVVCFGELLIRLSGPGHQRLLQSPSLDVAIGGAEANVAVCLARFGDKARIASVVADNELGQAAIAEIRKHGVDTGLVRQTKGRMGLYFLSHGAVSRPSAVLYDRADSAFAKSAADLTLPAEVLAGAEWLHVSGVTPAVGPEASKAALALVEAATQAGVKVSFDGNYRAQLWAAWAGDGPAILKQILSHATLAFINERDVELILGERFAGREAALQRAFEAFPRLQWIAATTRTLASVTHQGLQGEMVSRTERYVSKDHELAGVVDRIGAGDAFAAGLLHGLLAQHEPQACLEFAVASAVIKHSIPGDFNLTNLQEVTEAMAGGGLDVRR